MIASQILQLASERQGLEIPKPKAKAPFRIKGLGTRRGEPALIYTIPSHTGRKPYEKGITLTEFEKAVKHLNQTGQMDRAWFNNQLPLCAKEGGCNFTSLGGIFEILGIARFDSQGTYTAV